MALGWRSKLAGPERVRIWQRPDTGFWVSQKVALGIARGEIPLVREDREEPVATLPVQAPAEPERKLWWPGKGPPPGREDEDEEDVFW